MFPIDTDKALMDIRLERQRQDELVTSGRFDFTCADDQITHEECYAVLGEEFGEVGREVLHTKKITHDSEGDWHSLRKELIQVAAVATAWAEKCQREIMRENGFTV